jgi:hypothetical protein
MTDLEFNGRSSYKDTYTGIGVEKDNFINFGAKSSFK